MATLLSTVVETDQSASRKLGETTETLSFNARRQLTGISAATASGTTLLNLGYGYGTSNNGRIRSRTDGVQPEHTVSSYGYDKLNRLTSATGTGWSVDWTLDNYGNRMHQDPHGLAEGRVGTQQISIAPDRNRNTDWTYDNAGNVINDGSHTYQYDAESRLRSIDNGAVQFTYDSGGRRIAKTIQSTTTFYIYGLTGLLSEFSTTNSGTLPPASDDTIQYRVAEQTGTAVLLLDGNGTVIENNRVFPFGEPWQLAASSNNDQAFTSYDRDSATGLDYAMARYYASRSGRFMSPDPGHIGGDPSDPQSWNAYAYTANDPINRTDPSGENYIVEWDHGGRFDIEDADYESYRSDMMRLGAILPGPLGGDWPDDQFVGTITYNGNFVGRVDYYATTAQRFAREMNKRAEASENLIAVAAGGSVLLGVTGGLAAYYTGATAGAGLTEFSVWKNTKVVMNWGHRLLEVRPGHLPPPGTAVQIQKAVEAAVRTGNLRQIANGVLEGKTIINGIEVGFRGKLVDGVLRVATVFTRF